MPLAHTAAAMHIVQSFELELNPQLVQGGNKTIPSASPHSPFLCGYFPSSCFSKLDFLSFLRGQNATPVLLVTSGVYWCQVLMHRHRGFPPHLPLVKLHLLTADDFQHQRPPP